MNLTSPPTTITATANATTPETDTETPPPTKLSDDHHPTKILSFTNGALKHHHHSSAAALTQSPSVYKECLKNHAASLGGHALDGCGEFMPSPTAIASDPTSLKCAACGCHRNFHRREPEDGGGGGTHIVEYIPHPHPVLQPRGRSPSSASPPPISSSYYPSAPHMLLALSTGGNKHENSHGAGAGAVNNNNSNGNVNGGGNAATTGSGGGRKRFRTKFSQEQKEKMLSFSERLGWKMQKRDEGLVEEFCNEVGVGKGVLKVWMHNNKHTFAAKRSDVNSGSSTDDQPPPPHLLLHGNNPNTINNNNNSNTVTGHDHNHHISVRGHVVSNNGSSSSS